MQKVTPSLWFDNNCEEAMRFYTTLFPDSKITGIQYYPEHATDPHLQGMEGKVLHGEFELHGHKFIALDGGPLFTFNPSISFMINFDPSRDPNAREHLDELWEKLSDGGTALMPLDEYPFSKRYGWIRDKYGLTWQLMLTDPGGEERPDLIPFFLFVGDNCGKAKEATDFYISLFKDAQRGTLALFPAGSEPEKEGNVMFTDFTLAGQWFAAMESALQEHNFTFNEAISLTIECADQAEVDYFWKKLSAVPQAEQCGWVKDQYGVSWQIVPRRLGELISDPDKEKAGRVMEALMPMKKIDIAQLEAVYNG